MKWIHPDDPKAIRKYSGIKGHNQPWLFNVDALVGAESAFIVEGELDAIIMWQQGYAAVSATAGASSFSLSWGVHFLNVRRRYTVFDEDDGGREGAAKAARMVPMGRDIRLGLEMDKADIAEFLLDYRDGEAQGAHSRAGRCPKGRRSVRLRLFTVANRANPALAGVPVHLATTAFMAWQEEAMTN